MSKGTGVIANRGNTRRKVDFLQDQLTKRDFTVSCNMARFGFLWMLLMLVSNIVGEDSHFDSYFSDGLVQPPTRSLLFF